MPYKAIITYLVLLLSVFTGIDSVRAKLTVHSQTSLKIELIGYNGLAESSIFQGEFTAGSNREIDTPYRGLSFLVLADGQRYPVILGEKSFILKFVSPDVPPTFVGSDENDSFYNAMSGGNYPPEKYDMALLMIRAKELLESSQSVRTVKELITKKKEYYQFVRMHYDKLKYSDMVRRLIAQYFMMHEYVNYHTGGYPATDILARYQKEVISGVKSWMGLKTYLSEQEILDYCVSLYYNRSMVTLASHIIDNFRDVAFCAGTEKKPSDFPGNLRIVKKKGAKGRKLGDLKGDKLIALVSDDCSLSMIETVIKARQLAAKKQKTPVIVAPLQRLSERHFAMARMISNGNMYFIDDEKWRRANLNEKIKLPFFVRIEEAL